MTKEELHEYLKESLSLSIDLSGYGDTEEIDIILCLEGEDISSITFQVPS